MVKKTKRISRARPYKVILQLSAASVCAIEIKVIMESTTVDVSLVRNVSIPTLSYVSA